MKGYLKSVDGGLFQLAPKVTTIGREGCDLTVQTPGVDYQHAVIEFSEQEQCFVLQDLNTSQGTYVNECRVQNAAVRLAPGDQIRFGANSMSYELEVENPAQISYPPVYQRTAWSAPLTVITDSTQATIYSNDTLPHLQSNKPPVPTWSQQSNNPSMPPPRPPPATMRARPLSAGSVAIRNGPQSGWVSGGSPARTIMTNGGTTDNITVMQEKEQKVLRLQEEVRRLIMYESECNRKEELVQTLREEIADLQGRLRQMETARSALVAGGSEAGVISKLEMELQQKRLEISRMKSGDPNAAISREDFNTRVMEVNSLRNELERTKKDKNVTSGLVTQMQRDMANKDTSISRLTRDLENQKKELKDKDAQLLAMQAKFKRVDDNRKVDEELDAKEKELASMRLKTKATETRVQEQSDLIAQLKAEIERMKKEANDSREAQKKLSADLDAARSNCLDLERAERTVRVDLKQHVVKLERLQDRVTQVTFSTPGIKAPSERLGDDQLIESLKKVVGERTELYKQVKDLKENLTLANSTKREVTDSTKKLKQQLNESTSRLRQRGFKCSNVKQEIDLVSTVALAEGVTWMRDISVDLLKSVLTWGSDIEKALEECGINVKISEQSHAEHVFYLRQRGSDLGEEKERLEEMLEALKVSSKMELEEAVMRVRDEVCNRTTDEVERVKLMSEESLNRQIEEIRLLEEERRITSIETEKSKVNELEVTLAQLKASMLEKEEEYKSHRETARHALEEMEVYKRKESELRETVYRLEMSVQESSGRLATVEGAAGEKYSAELTNYKEQLRQHSTTIVTLEERLNKVLKKNKDYQTEVTELKATIHELKTRPRPPTGPKPKVIVQKAAQDGAALEQMVNQLRKENVDLKKQLNDQQTVITGLRRDLTGASAKLSDMTGELTEQQKRKLEKEREVLLKKDTELVESRSNMAKLSSIIDKQKTEVHTLKDEISKHKSAMSKLKNMFKERETRVTQLEEKVRQDEEVNKIQLNQLQEEGRITSELSSIGAQCRGDRHEQVITRQREALTELRFRIKALEMSNPSVPSHDQALQQVMLLKKELAELRAKEAISENRMITDSLVDRQINRARGVSPAGVAEQNSAEIERSAHRETMEALEYSENSYLTLLRSISLAMELEDVAGLRSMSHIPRDERQRLFTDREQSCELLASRVKVLRERISRKDDLLQGYEKDLSKLRQSEMLADHRASQVEGLATDVRDRTEEMQYLREALQRTRERLDQEKRLNVAIKSKKTFHMENERPPSHRSSGKPHCEVVDVMGKKDLKKKDKVERTKRKNYEIKVLKNELEKRDEDMTKLQRSMMSIQRTGKHQDRELCSPDFAPSFDPFVPPT